MSSLHTIPTTSSARAHIATFATVIVSFIACAILIVAVPLFINEHEARTQEQIVRSAHAFFNTRVHMPNDIGMVYIDDVHVACGKRITTTPDRKAYLHDLDGKKECVATLRVAETFQTTMPVCIKEYFGEREYTLAPDGARACPQAQKGGTNTLRNVVFDERSTYTVSLPFVYVNDVWVYIPHAIVVNTATRPSYLGYHTP